MSGSLLGDRAAYFCRGAAVSVLAMFTNVLQRAVKSRA
jgi:hypothetical protein